MKYLILFLSFSVCVALHQPKTIFVYNNQDYTDVDFFEQVFKDDWDSYDKKKKQTLFDDYLKKELSFIAAQEIGVDLIPSIQTKLTERYKALLINNTYEHLIARPMVDSAVVNKNIDFLSYKAETYHLLVGFDGSTQKTEAILSQVGAKALADSLYFLINNDSLSLVDSFIFYAKTYSLDPSSEKNGGFLGWVPWGRTVMSFQEPLFNLELGVLSKPVLTEYGYHLILKTNQAFSNHYFYSKEHYKDLAHKVAQNTLSFEILRGVAAQHDSLLLKKSGFIFNQKGVDSLFSFLYQKQLIEVGGNKNILIGWLKELSDFGVLFVAQNKGFGVGWFIDKLEKTPASRIPPIDKQENLLLSLRSLFLQDLVLLEGEKNGIASTSSFKRDLSNNFKGLLYNEYVSFLLNSISLPDSSEVLGLYNQGVFNKDFVLPPRVVFSEIRVFDFGVAENVGFSIGSGQDFELLLVEFGGSIKEPVSEGASTPLSVVAFSLPVGGVSDIIKNNDGSFSFIRVERFLGEELFDVGLVYSQIERKIISQKQENIKTNLLGSLIKKLNITINYGVLGL